jgi:UDP-glucose 4-epimerase
MTAFGAERVLVTGGAGFIGASLVRELVARGRPVTVLDDFSAGDRRYLEGCSVEVVGGDVRDAAVLERVVPGHGAVVHLAAQTGVPSSLADPLSDCDVNVIGTIRLLEAARAHRVDRFVFASSNAPLGRVTSTITESAAPQPVSPYGASKLAGEGYCLAYHGSWGLRTVALRFSNVYGPFSAHKHSVVARFMRDVIEQGRMTLEGEGRARRDFLFVADASRAIIRALETDAAGEVFQIATGIQTTISDLAARVAEIAGVDADVDTAPARAGDAAGAGVLIDKARHVLGWRPEVELDLGLRHTWEWTKEWLTRSGA